MPTAPCQTRSWASGWGSFRGGKRLTATCGWGSRRGAMAATAGRPPTNTSQTEMFGVFVDQIDVCGALCVRSVLSSKEDEERWSDPWVDPPCLEQPSLQGSKDLPLTPAVQLSGLGIDCQKLSERKDRSSEIATLLGLCSKIRLYGRAQGE